jgi:hypothetical protein
MSPALWNCFAALAVLTASCASGVSNSPSIPSSSSTGNGFSNLTLPSVNPAVTVGAALSEPVRQPCADGAAPVVQEFLRSIDAGDVEHYERCEGVTQGRERIDGLWHGGWIMTIQDASAEVVRFNLQAPKPPAETYVAEGSIVHGLVPQSGSIVTVTRAPGGGYFVTDIAFYSST